MPASPQLRSPEFGRWLAEERERKGSHERFALALRPYLGLTGLKVARQQIKKFEAGQPPGWLQLIAISAVLEEPLELTAARLFASLEMRNGEKVFSAYDKVRHQLGQADRFSSITDLGGDIGGLIVHDSARSTSPPDADSLAAPGLLEERRRRDLAAAAAVGRARAQVDQRLESIEEATAAVRDTIRALAATFPLGRDPRTQPGGVGIHPRRDRRRTPRADRRRGAK